jgi:hypothetical protein
MTDEKLFLLHHEVVVLDIEVFHDGRGHVDERLASAPPL